MQLLNRGCFLFSFIAHLKCVFGTVARLLDVNHLQYACVLDLLQHKFIIKVQLFL